MGDVITDIREQAYASRKREPLAAVPSRGYKWPAETQNQTFQFGTKIEPSEFSAKEIIFPTNPKYDSEKDHK